MIATGSAQLVLLSLSCLISLSVELLGAIVLEWDNDGFVTELGFPTAFTSGASRFDMGGRPNIVLFPPLVAGMEQVQCTAYTITCRLHDCTHLRMVVIHIGAGLGASTH